MEKLHLIVALFAFSDLSLTAKNVVITGLSAENGFDNRQTIQDAIDTCSASGGGEVIFPADAKTYFSRTPIILKSNVLLNLPFKTTLKSIKTENGGPAVIYAKDAENVGVIGMGTIDGSGDVHMVKDFAPGRIRTLFFEGCKNARLTGVNVINASFWNIYFLRCDTVFIDSIRVVSHDNYNNDGIDIDSRNVVISNCIIDSDDDAICLKSHSRDFIVENISITNCVISSNCNFIKFGTANHGGFKNISISNCVLKKCSDSKLRKWSKKFSRFGISADICGLAGVAIEAVDGGFVEDVAISNLTMQDVQTPVFIRVGHRNKDEKKSYVNRVIISGIAAKSVSWLPNSMTATDGHTLKNITFRDCYFNMKANPSKEAAKNMLEKGVNLTPKNEYPENRMFGNLPAYGFLMRNVKSVVFENVQLSYYSDKEFRPAIYGENVEDFNMLNCRLRKAEGVDSVMVKDAIQINSKTFEDDYLSAK